VPFVGLYGLWGGSVDVLVYVISSLVFVVVRA
jgi:hypothetical protein